jgi:tetratricopeptide (TPR) repeat protein
MKTYYRVCLLTLFSLLIGGCSFGPKLERRKIYEHVSPFLYYYNGVKARIYGDNSSAIDFLNKAKEREPRKDAIYYELALSHVALNNIDSAIHNLERAVSIDSLNLTYRELLRALYIESNQYVKALSNQSSILNIDSANNFNQFQLALLYAELDSLEQSLGILEKIELTDGFNPGLVETKLKIFLRRSNISHAKKELLRLLAFSPDNPHYLMYQSDIYFIQGYDVLGLQVLDTLLSRNPKFIYAKYELYNKELTFGSKDRALKILSEIFSDSLQRDEEKARLFYPLLFDKSLYTSRTSKLDSIIKIGLHYHPNSLLINEIAFEHNLRTNNFSNAKKILTTIVNLDSSNPDKFEQLVNFQYSMGNKDDLLITLSRAIELFPQKSIFYIYQAIVYDDQKDFHKSIQSLKNGIDNVTDKIELSELYGTLGDMHYRQLNSQKMYKSYQNSLKHNPSNSRVLNNYAYYLALDKKKLIKALEMSTKAVALEPNNSTYIDTRGWILFTLKRYEEARDVLRNAIAKDGSTSAVINEHYGDALYKTGNKERAFIYWDKAKELGGGTEKLDIKINTKTYVP